MPVPWWNGGRRLSDGPARVGGDHSPTRPACCRRHCAGPAAAPPGAVAAPPRQRRSLPGPRRGRGAAEFPAAEMPVLRECGRISVPEMPKAPGQVVRGPVADNAR
ncbi:hypothetical protein GCM10010505_27800 [Kitasatospora aburaviensis]